MVPGVVTTGASARGARKSRNPNSAITAPRPRRGGAARHPHAPLGAMLGHTDSDKRVPLVKLNRSQSEGVAEGSRPSLGFIGRRATVAGRRDARRQFADSRRLDSQFLDYSHALVLTPKDIADYSPVAARMFARMASVAEYIAPADREPSAEEAVGKEEEVGLQTNSEAIVNLLNNCLGSGMLTMGFAVAKAGILPSIAMMLLSTFLNRFTLLLNLRSCQLADADPASSEIAEKAFGGVGRVAFILLYSTFGFLCCVSYVDAAADAMSGLLSLVLADEPPTSLVLVGCWALLLLPTTLLRSLKAVALLSFVAFAGGVLMLAAVSIYCTEQLLVHGLPSPSQVTAIRIA